ncbi:sensor histidine kinase [Janthinobacterium agaricidamnosum]|uniref:histidine kinase n=1 Tax=Janthinobacterium agaricidamnosum NBRC 102515 = DSM 9628 TaxID=1349767 RepID=W0V995_9BURK|nr:sensor histidine kinase [Janthinobacterium agaricidamnosum]CDG84170.1 HAMP domain protein [Janthinobacterium agaricidamnosum NBRC 102515 = DSM 9628]
MSIGRRLAWLDRLPGKGAGHAATLGSLRNQLLRWLLIPLVMLVLLDAVFVYRNALDAADMAYDRSLLASTRALAERVSIVNGKVVAEVPYVALDSFETDTLGRIYYKVTGINGELVSGYGDLPPVPKNVPRSENYPALVRFYHADYNGKPIRIAALLQPVYDDSMRGIALIQVAETLDARRGLSNQILFDTLIWQAAMVLAMATLVWCAVRLVLQPLMRLKTAVETRTLADLSDVDPTLVHKEMRPLVVAMNGSMGRLQNLIAGQRRFIADASHQLRTPLTVLKTQAELALRACDREPDSQHNLAALREIVQSIAVTTDSTVHLANRLLTLARIEHGAEAASMDSVSLRAVVHQVALEMAMSAVNRNIDLSLEALHDSAVRGQALLLHELVANLVDNALRYTPPGGSVILRVRQQSGERGALLEVEDSGAGIAAAEREKVLTPFYRVNSAFERNPGGAGLGLAIVSDIAALHGARITLADGGGGRGLKVVLEFPAQA